MRFCKLVPLDTFSIIQSLSGNPPTLHYPHQSTALTLSKLLTLPEVVNRSPLLLPREVFTHEGPPRLCTKISF